MAKRIININLPDVERLDGLQCTLYEAAAFFNIPGSKFSQIMKKFPEVQEAWDRGREAGKTSLRRKQWRLAGSSASMAIHLGKNILSQKDAVSHEHSGPEGGPIQTL